MYYLRRAAASVIDGLTVALVVAITSAVGLLFAYFSVVDLRWEGQVAQTLLTAFYYTAGNSRLTGGATLGKRALGLRTTDGDSQAIPIQPAFLRTLVVMFLAALFVPIQWLVVATIPMTEVDELIATVSLGFAAALFLPLSVLIGGGRGLHDVVVGTYVVDRTRQAKAQTRTPSIWMLAGRAFSLALALSLFISASGITHFKGLFEPERRSRLLRWSISSVTARSGRDITQPVQLLLDVLPQLVERAQIRSGVESVPTLPSQQGQTSEALNKRARHAGWLTITITLAPEFSRGAEQREWMAHVAARYVADRYETRDLLVMVTTTASTRFGIAGVVLSESRVVQFIHPNSWLVLRPDRARAAQFGFSSPSFGSP